jgi:hypothetical protein
MHELRASSALYLQRYSESKGGVVPALADPVNKQPRRVLHIAPEGLGLVPGVPPTAYRRKVLTIQRRVCYCL